jgi:2'-5' RNA ligase
VDSLRLFTAVRPPEDALEAVVDARRRLTERIGDRAVRWVPDENLHVTLHFLGKSSPELIGDIEQAMRDAARRLGGGVDLTLSGVGAFPSARRPRILWVGVADGGERLAELQRDLQEPFRKLGFDPDERPFHPHITIGKVRKRIPSSDRAAIAAALDETEPEERAFHAEELLLVQSVLGSAGATYTAIRAVPL